MVARGLRQKSDHRPLHTRPPELQHSAILWRAAKHFRSHPRLMFFSLPRSSSDRTSRAVTTLPCPAVSSLATAGRCLSHCLVGLWQVLCCIPPSKTNMAVYLAWLRLENRRSYFLGALVQDAVRVEVRGWLLPQLLPADVLRAGQISLCISSLEMLRRVTCAHN